MTVAETIEQKIRAAFDVTDFQLENESHKHAGHAGSPGHGNSHFKLLVVSPDFVGKNRVARQRDIYRVLKDELAGPVHALSLDARAPE
ncbi:BolA family protein [Paremcibacter congregatus]|jgi:BolA protein|uniref:BolA family transcriptional regulator n=1 Tax=Paremcibacter congregatus TaxID=2043170 RepID=A0A2G4YVU9_9PROT|nr:BolA family protein [Paremcibacter congregatus]PHZ86449.1 BolA family transcriptional regulator [Paremcibacter congregatus]QDE28454.1 BolA family transcriptional regulator [Paremcibacter congregatus]|tara:strand:- start:352 stop:615 length:264 start_codon:yes stop_codon:yes gene_type:complete